MATKALETSVRRAGVVSVISLEGEIDGFAEEALNHAYTAAAAPDVTAVLLKFDRVDYINSTGIALIVGLLAQARKSGRRLLTSGLSQHYREIFQITRLSDFMQIYPDEATALAQNA
ncbi:MAG: STAS domain-containing protein [Anaerolineales bacterium]|nr:STAS domain-containing protein [Anaerolineales bacterium]